MVQDHLGNEFKSEIDMIAFYNINPSTYKHRIRSGKTKEEALTTPVKPRSKKVTDHLGNEFDSESAMCKFYNIPYVTYRNRIRSGKTKKEVLTTPVSIPKKVTDHLGNEFDSICDMCKSYGINEKTYHGRIRSGLSKKEALTTPVRSKRDLGGASVNKSTNKQPETQYDIDHTLTNNEKGVLLPKANNMSKKYKKIKKEDDSNIEDISIIDSEDTSTQIRKTDIYAEIMNDASISSSTRLYILFKLCEKTICHNVGMHLYYALLDWKEHNINNIVVPEKYKKYL
jgi:hypothetical protein